MEDLPPGSPSGAVCPRLCLCPCLSFSSFSSSCRSPHPAAETWSRTAMVDSSSWGPRRRRLWSVLRRSSSSVFRRDLLLDWTRASWLLRLRIPRHRGLRSSQSGGKTYSRKIMSHRLRVFFRGLITYGTVDVELQNVVVGPVVLLESLCLVIWRTKENLIED